MSTDQKATELAIEHLRMTVLPARALAIDQATVLVDELELALAEIDRLNRQLAALAPYAEAGKQVALERAKRDYYNGTCDSCTCCTTAQCAEHRCPTNSIGDSICPCTCD